MISIAPTTAPPARLSPEQYCWGGIAALVAVLLVSVAAWTVDERLLNGVSVWSKPIKFQLALIVHLLTIVLIAERMSEPERHSTWLRVIVMALLASGVFEIGYIMIQAGRQLPSHFNRTTMLYSVLYGLMGVGAVILVVAAAVVGWRVQGDAGARLGPATRLGIGQGLIGGAIATVIVASAMARGEGHHVGQQVSDAGGLWLMGWSTEVGDLRPAHFFATHAMQALPLAGLVLDRLPWPMLAKTVLWLLAVGWMALVAALFIQARQGLPILAI